MRHIEENLQVSCVKWFDLQYPKLRLFLHHSPNGGYRNALEAKRFKAMGVRAGFPDLIFLFPGFYGAYIAIEFKSSIGRQTDAQKAYQSALHKGCYFIVRSFEQFSNIIKTHLNQINKS